MGIRTILGLAITLQMSAVPAAAQPSARAFVGGLIGAHHESSDWADGDAFTAGAVGGAWLTRTIGVEVEVSRPADLFVREYEGISVSFAPPGASRAEIERLGVYSRFTRQRTVKSTVSFGILYGVPVHPRWTPRVFVGVTNRHVEDRGTVTNLYYPEELTPEQIASVQLPEDRATRNLGAVTVGGGVAFAVTKDLSVAPDVRFDYGSFGDEINNSARSSVRALWTF